MKTIWKSFQKKKKKPTQNFPWTSQTGLFIEWKGTIQTTGPHKERHRVIINIDDFNIYHDTLAPSIFGTRVFLILKSAPVAYFFPKRWSQLERKRQLSLIGWLSNKNRKLAGWERMSYKAADCEAARSLNKKWRWAHQHDQGDWGRTFQLVANSLLKRKKPTKYSSIRCQIVWWGWTAFILL